MADDLRKSALEYHRLPIPGKLGIVATKPLSTQRDLALAYSPGVAEACLVIVDDPREAATVTARANLVGVISNGTAVLGLGAIGPLASKPVMEGKAVLFKKFAGIDVFDIEVDATNPELFVNVVAALEPTFGGINLEDIKAPECFEIESRLRERMKIPVFHDDQHGTAIIVAAAIHNALRLTGRKLEEIKLVASGAGAAAIACLDLLVDMGLPVENIWVTDKFGVVYEGRKEEMEPRKGRYAKVTNARSLADVIDGAGVFLGLSAAGVLKPEMLATMTERPIIMALANPTPEISPEEAKAVRPDAIICTGRSDYPNQVNNVLCFPYIFRGALDVGATTINEAMKIACVKALADLALAEPSDMVAAAYGDAELIFGPDYLIPKPFDPRLITTLAPAVAKAAMESGVATRPITDFDAYHERLSQFVFRSGLVMKPVIDRAKQDPKRLVYAEGEDERVLRAVQNVIDDGIAKPILIGRRDVVERRLRKLGLHIRIDQDFALCDPEDDPRFHAYWTLYHRLMERKGVTPDSARTLVRTRNTLIGALMVHRGEADALLCGAVGQYQRHLEHIVDVMGVRQQCTTPFTLTALLLPTGTYFFCDCYLMENPTAAEIAEMTIEAAAAVRHFGIEPKAALLSHSNFGSSNATSARKMREALDIITTRAPDLEVEGEMNADTALSTRVRQHMFPNSRLKGPANLMVMPSLDAANITLNMCKMLGDGQQIGPILMGVKQTAHIVTPSVTTRGIFNMSAVAVYDAQVNIKATEG
ncbi:MAG TPA: NADP-dependent malic enzyme [Stellaceae bacterium]|nr:NADP-dependent malic enzyme [Stellaceae bacterium]